MERGQRGELVREHGRASRGVEQEAEQAYQAAMQQPIQIGTEDQEAVEQEVKRQRIGAETESPRLQCKRRPTRSPMAF